MTPIRIPAQAWEEVFASAQWYDDQQGGLGAELLQAIEDCLLAIQKNPLQFARVDLDARCARTKRFPCGIFYSIEPDGIIVFAILDLRRSPRRWKHAKKKRKKH